MERVFVMVWLLVTRTFAVQYSTDFELACNSQSDSRLAGGSCLVPNPNAQLHAEQVTHCATVIPSLGSGRLIIPGRRAITAALTEITFASGASNKVFIGIYQVDTSDEPSGGWHYYDTTVKRPIEFPPMMPFSRQRLVWKSGQPNNGFGFGDQQCGALVEHSGEYFLDDVNCDSTARTVVCEYVDNASYDFRYERVAESQTVPTAVITEGGMMDPICSSFTYNHLTQLCVMASVSYGEVVLGGLTIVDSGDQSDLWYDRIE